MRISLASGPAPVAGVSPVTVAARARRDQATVPLSRTSGGGCLRTLARKSRGSGLVGPGVRLVGCAGSTYRHPSARPGLPGEQLRRRRPPPHVGEGARALAARPERAGTGRQRAAHRALRRRRPRRQPQTRRTALRSASTLIWTAASLSQNVGTARVNVACRATRLPSVRSGAGLRPPCTLIAELPRKPLTTGHATGALYCTATRRHRQPRHSSEPRSPGPPRPRSTSCWKPGP